MIAIHLKDKPKAGDKVTTSNGDVEVLAVGAGTDMYFIETTDGERYQLKRLNGNNAFGRLSEKAFDGNLFTIRKNNLRKFKIS